MSKSPDSDAPTGGAAESDLPDIPAPPELESHGPARIISMVNQKGGVGKTTSTVSLGAALAGYGRRVLLVDFDPQGALSVALGYNPNDMELTVYNLITDPECHLGDVLVPTDVPGLELLPSNIDLSAAEIQLVSEVGREYALQRALAPVIDDYDIILIDCQPSLGLLTVNALTSSTDVIIPQRDRVLRAARGGAAHRHHQQGDGPTQPEPADSRGARHDVRPPHPAQPRGIGNGHERLRGPGGFLLCIHPGDPRCRSSGD
jgi:ATPases involved in chromosome partitioning